MQQVNFQKTRPEFEGDMTIVVFPFVKLAGRNPEQLANEMGAEMIKESDMIAKFNVVKGFLNLLISDKFWMDFFKANHENREFGRKPVSGKNVVIEYSSPNTNKPLHLGHIRNNLGQRPWHPHLQEHVGLAEVGQWLHARVDGQEGRPPHRRLLCVVRQEV